MFHPVVHSFMLSVLTAWQAVAFGGPSAPELVRTAHASHIVSPCEALAEQTLDGLVVALALHQEIEHASLLLHGWPKGVLLPTKREEDLVQLPGVTTRTATPPLVGRGLSEGEAPRPPGLRGEDDPACCQKLLHIAGTEPEAQGQPEAMTAHLRREAKPFGVGSSDGCFPPTLLAPGSAPCPH